jgi:DNA-directed RNA polymerase specialized sigma24 family protein
MTGAPEIFVRELARASRRATSFLRRKALQRAERDDIISAAVAWCWENKGNYSLTTALDTWLLNAVRDAFKDWRRGELKHDAEAILGDIPTANTTENSEEARSAAKALIRALPPEYRRVAILLARGLTRAQITERGISHDTIYSARLRIKQLRRLLPEPSEYRSAIRAPMAPDYYESRQSEPSEIDKAIERLEFAPQHGADCPPCWRCRWFDGFMPTGSLFVRMDIVEPEVRDAVARTEAEKIRIAQEVRDGYLRI